MVINFWRGNILGSLDLSQYQSKICKFCTYRTCTLVTIPDHDSLEMNTVDS